MSTWEQFDKKYLSQLLMRRSAYRIRDQIWDVYYRLNIRDAISFVDQVGQAVTREAMSCPPQDSLCPLCLAEILWQRPLSPTC